MPTESTRIVTRRGHHLAGSLEMPPGPVRGAALFAHCFTCTKQSLAAVAVTRAMAREGLASLRVDFTGLGSSGGDFGKAGFASDVEDVIDSASYLADRFGPGVLLVGHSLGGAAVLAAADKLPEAVVGGIATIGTPAHVPHVLHNVNGDLAAIEREGQGEVMIGGRRFVLDREFLDKTRSIDLLQQVSKLRVPLLFCHSPTDEIVGIENAAELFVAAKHPKSFVSLSGADHLLTDAKDCDYIADLIACWGRRYLPTLPA